MQKIIDIATTLSKEKLIDKILKIYLEIIKNKSLSKILSYCFSTYEEF